jgi:hypothetical protein
LLSFEIVNTMKKNMGKADRWIRLVAGLLVGAAGIYFNSWWGLIGVVLVATSLINWCPLYVPFGISTKKSEK